MRLAPNRVLGGCAHPGDCAGGAELFKEAGGGVQPAAVDYHALRAPALRSHCIYRAQ